VRWIDLIPRAGVSLGNVDTSFRLGGMVRVGVNLPNDFGVETISSLTTTAGGRPKGGGHEWGFYVFGGGEASIVAYTAFLDGNLFRHSHHVDKEPLVGEWKMGAVAVLNWVELGFTYAYRSPQFVGQRKLDGYGSVLMQIRRRPVRSSSAVHCG
jgi:lipid A 3-O-deacylase